MKRGTVHQSRSPSRSDGTMVATTFKSWNEFQNPFRRGATIEFLHPNPQFAVKTGNNIVSNAVNAQSLFNPKKKPAGYRFLNALLLLWAATTAAAPVTAAAPIAVAAGTNPAPADVTNAAPVVPTHFKRS
jgi:hypothetical protein